MRIQNLISMIHTQSNQAQFWLCYIYQNLEHYILSAIRFGVPSTSSLVQKTKFIFNLLISICFPCNPFDLISLRQILYTTRKKNCSFFRCHKEYNIFKIFVCYIAFETYWYFIGTFLNSVYKHLNPRQLNILQKYIWV